ncbi:hypothetical protein AAG570_009047 [Ranatra chinensis]|uniref:Uncharacterized protein n=1 Tax=Ranatra chinensis TaxID=642074 RepID=A0ABD0YSS7_9HEMI
MALRNQIVGLSIRYPSLETFPQIKETQVLPRITSLLETMASLKMTVVVMVAAMTVVLMTADAAPGQMRPPAPAPIARLVDEPTNRVERSPAVDKHCYYVIKGDTQKLICIDINTK